MIEPCFLLQGLIVAVLFCFGNGEVRDKRNIVNTELFLIISVVLMNKVNWWTYIYTLFCFAIE